MVGSATDFDVVMPEGNEEQFIATARSLGYRRIVFLTDDMDYKAPKNKDVDVKTAYLLRNISQLNLVRKRFDHIFADATRELFESKVDFIAGLEESDRKDSFHYRSTSLNQVHALLARKNGIILAFNFSTILDDPFIMLGRMMQNASLVRKYKLQHSIFSFAKRPSEMRSRTVLDALDKMLF
jgi:RNase P/RNase MRP subunit p30